jgi:putative ATPase
MDPTLFEPSPERNANVNAPLAARMRPRSLDEFVGQDAIVGEGRALRRAIETDSVPSLILWGPPGTGKTTLAEIVARTTGAHFAQMSAVSAGVADLRKVVAQAQTRKRMGQRSVLFIDEIHRFNKAQQDAVLPYVEDGTITLIGATTENPSFEVNSALLSRSRVFVLQALEDEAIGTLVDRALGDTERGLGASNARLESDARETLIDLANGDARTALNTLEFAVAAAPDVEGVRTVTREKVLDAMQRRAATYDKGGDGHYDTISAFIKSIRASDPDAAVYWLARMLDAGEDILFVARRLVILASEDVGLADSRGLQVAMAAQQAVHFVGMPEAFFALAHATLFLALAPKSNSVGRAYSAAMQDVQETRNDPVPLHLRNAPTRLMKNLGYGRDYHYAHEDYDVVQFNLPENLRDRRYYEPGDRGAEAKLTEWLKKRRSD